MKKDRLQEFFEKNNIKEINTSDSILGGAPTKTECLTSYQTAGDIGACDNDTSKRSDNYDKPCVEVGHSGTID